MTRIPNGWVPVVTQCPSCGRRHTFSMNYQQIPPEDGDLSVCFHCCHVHIFVVGRLGVGLRHPTPAEQIDIDADPQIRQIRAAAARALSPLGVDPATTAVFRGLLSDG